MIRFKPTRKRIVITVVLFLLYVSVFLFTMNCPLIQMICESEEVVPGSFALPTENGDITYQYNAYSAWMGCSQHCTKQASFFAGLTTFVLTVLLPLIAIYVIACLIFRK